MSLRLPLPHEINAVLGRDQDRPQDGDNVGLWLDKFLRVRDRDDRGWTWSLKMDDRVSELRNRVCRAPFGKPQPQRSEAAKEAVERMRSTAKLLYQPEPEPETKTKSLLVLRGSVQGRLLVDYGRASAHELAVSMHHVFGCPRIPGSALKGVTRAWMDREGSKADLDVLFGRAPTDDFPAMRGAAVFHDALPVDGTFKLATDVLTPHYGEYYRGTAPPAEWLSPVPHTFVTVVETTFEFVVGSLDPGVSLEPIRDALGQALEYEGVGAKTAAGYGRMSVEEVGG